MESLEKFLFLVVVGGRSHKANIELHDVRWVIGSKIEDTFDQLRNDQEAIEFLMSSGLFLHCYSHLREKLRK